MVRRMSETGHVKRSIKIPEAFLTDAKPLRSTAAPTTPVLPYLAMEEYRKQREHELRESIAVLKAKQEEIERKKQAVQNAAATPSEEQTLNGASSDASQQYPPIEEAQTSLSENDPDSSQHAAEPNHFFAKHYTSQPIPWSDRKGTSAPLPDETQALALQQAPTPQSEPVSESLPPEEAPIRHAPGEVYINEEGRRVRLVKKPRPPRLEGDSTGPHLAKRRPKKKKNTQRNGSPGSPNSKSKVGNSKSGTSPNGNTGPKKRRKKPRQPQLTDYPTSIGIPMDYEERSVQSDLNMLSLGDLTPTEIAKMEPPSDRTPPCTPDSRNSNSPRVASPATADGKVLFPRDRNSAATNCGCIIS